MEVLDKPHKISGICSTAPNQSTISRNSINYSLGNPQPQQSLTAIPTRRDSLKVSNSVQTLKIRPEFLPQKDSRYSSLIDYPNSNKPLFYSFKDPGKRPICDKNACFDKKYCELPENRLKLLVNQKILNMDQAALSHISSKLAQEQLEENEKAKKYSEFRKQLLTATATRRKNIEILQARTGLLRYTAPYTQCTSNSSARIGLLSIPKTSKKGFAEDYSDSYGLLKAGLLESGSSVLPKSARLPTGKVYSPFPLQIVKRNKHHCKMGGITKDRNEEQDIYSNDEIRECMKEITEFHKRFGELKGRVGFPQIYLDKDDHN